ncbi:MAG: BREX-2 system phosphatase PglZ [Acidobacteriota bacterium]
MTEALLVSQVAALLKRAKPGDVIGIHSRSRWDGAETIAVESQAVRVAQCDSVLQIREVLSTTDQQPLVIVTALETPLLGDDVRARLYRQQLHGLDPWELLRARFRAKAIDPAVLPKTALANAALEALGSEEPPPAASGILTADAIWQVVLERRLVLRGPRPDARALLEWFQDRASSARYEALSEELMGLLRQWLEASLGGALDPLLGCLESGQGEEALAVGLALGVLRQDGGTPEARLALGLATGRLERFTGHRTLTPEAARVWNEAAEQWAVVKCGAGEQTAVRAQLERADQILEALGARQYAALGSWSPAGLAQRLETFGQSLSEALSGGLVAVSDEILGALERLRRHQAAQWFNDAGGRLERAEMAARLFRWLATPASVARDLGEAVGAYVCNGSWVDWAREFLLSGDEPEPVSRAYRLLQDRVTRRREAENRTFATHVAAATRDAQVPEQVLPIEQVLERIVASLARRGVLLIVMDGMSYGVWRELQLDLNRHGWVEWSTGASPLPPVLTALPAVTQVSRCSLLCGALAVGGQDAEKRGFAAQPQLVAASKAGYPPVLFHKEEVGPAGAAEAVRREIRNPNRRVVGAVINVVDDSLEGPEQRAFSWDLEQVPVLRTLLAEAREASRVVVLTSDHGHTLDRGAVLRRVDGAERHRTADLALLEPDEVLLRGPRVLPPGERVVALATEGVRYTPNRRRGYHGGLTPQECLVPIVVVAPLSAAMEGWQPVSEPLPEWWEKAAAPSPAPAPARARPKPQPALPLFEEASAPECDWVAALFRSDVFRSQVRIGGGRLKPEQVERALRVLAERGGVLLKSALAQRLEQPLLRIDGFIALLQRVLNVDGYPVLSVDASQTVRLDLSLLRTQFGLDGE